MHDTSPSFRLSEAGQYLELSTLQFAVPGAEHPWDWNRLEVQVRVHAGAFTGTFAACLQTMDFAQLHDDLQTLYGNLSHYFEFRPLERQVEFEMAGDGLGHIECAGTVMDQVGGEGSRLQFRLALDQTQVPQWLVDLKAILHAFPVWNPRGRGRIIPDGCLNWPL